MQTTEAPTVMDSQLLKMRQSFQETTQDNERLKALEQLNQRLR